VNPIVPGGNFFLYQSNLFIGAEWVSLAKVTFVLFSIGMKLKSQKVLNKSFDWKWTALAFLP
jgi:hypothetical protein